MSWIASLASRVQPKTIKSYLSHVRSLHVDNDLPFTSTEAPIVQRLIRGIKRFHGEKTIRPRLPITIAVLQKIVLDYTAPTKNDAVYSASSKLAFTGFLRCGEFTRARAGTQFSPDLNLTRSCVQFFPNIDTPDYIALNLPHSKTDPFRKGVTILVAAAPGSTTCAVTALRALFLDYPAEPNSPLFAMEDGSALHRAQFIERTRQAIRAQTSEDPNLYSGHSFRRGAASSAAAAGYSELEIQLLGRWRSDAYKLYIDVPVNRLLSLSTRLHLDAPDAPPFVPPVHQLAPHMA